MVMEKESGVSTESPKWCRDIVVICCSAGVFTVTPSRPLVFIAPVTVNFAGSMCAAGESTAVCKRSGEKDGLKAGNKYGLGIPGLN